MPKVPATDVRARCQDWRDAPSPSDLMSAVETGDLGTRGGDGLPPYENSGHGSGNVRFVFTEDIFNDALESANERCFRFLT